MFYRPKDGHGLAHNPFNAIVTPRPIGWISSRATDGTDNLAPYSFFNATAYTPPQLMFASTGTKPDQATGKDSLANIRETGVFCVNIVSSALRVPMNITSETAAAGTDEFAMASLAKVECTQIACARVAISPAALECEMTQIITQKGEENYIVLAEVVGIHLADDYIVDGRFDVAKFQPLARLGYRDYTVVDNLFTLGRPDD